VKYPLLPFGDNMAFTDNPLNPIDRVRMTVADTDPDNPFISDGWYEYYLAENNDNERLTALSIARKILAMYTGNTRQREGNVEIYGSEAFDNYLKWLQGIISNIQLSGMRAPMPYLGGSSKSDMLSNNAVADNVGVHTYKSVKPYNGQPSYTDEDSGYATLADPYRLQE
jgi:hypothetical protein